MELTGCCNFCKQSMVIDGKQFPIVDPDDQESIDIAVTSVCDCPEAKSERRKQEQAKKIEYFLNDQVPAELQGLFESAIDAVRTFSSPEVVIEDGDGWKCKIRVDKDGYLCIDRKKSLKKSNRF